MKRKVTKYASDSSSSSSSTIITTTTTTNPSKNSTKKDRTDPSLEEICVYAFDPGLTNFAIGRVSVLIDSKNPSAYYGVKLDWFEVLQLKYRTQEDFESKENPVSEEEMNEALTRELLTGKASKICEEYKKLTESHPRRLLNIIAEPQLDHIKSGGFQVPLLYAFYHCVQTFYRAIFPGRVNFVRWQGQDKSGLEKSHGASRKLDTIPVCIAFLVKEGFQSEADQVAALERPKPAQDVSDVYNMGRNFLLNYISCIGFTVESSSELDTSRRIQKKLRDMGIFHEQADTTHIDHEIKEMEEEAWRFEEIGVLGEYDHNKEGEGEGEEIIQVVPSKKKKTSTKKNKKAARKSKGRTAKVFATENDGDADAALDSLFYNDDALLLENPQGEGGVEQGEPPKKRQRRKRASSETTGTDEKPFSVFNVNKYDNPWTKAKDATRGGRARGSGRGRGRGRGRGGASYTSKKYPVKKHVSQEEVDSLISTLSAEIDSGMYDVINGNDDHEDYEEEEKQ